MTIDSETFFEWESLACWASTSPFESKLNVLNDPLSPPELDRAPFAVDQALNAKISLWKGPLWRLRVDAVVNSTCESLRDSDGVCGELLDAAGPQIHVECEAVGGCRTGETVITRGLAKENGLRSVAIGCIYSQRKAYPREEAAHVAARTVRRCLEHYADDFDRIILCMESFQDEFVYERVLPLYFPRTTREQRESQQELKTRDLGNSFGEPVIAERRIRIGDLGSSDHCTNEQADERFESHRGRRIDQFDDFVSNANNDEAKSDIKSFRSMLADPDVERLGRLKQMQEQRQQRAVKVAEEERKRLEKATATTTKWDYLAALKLARQEDFSDLKALGFCYYGGIDLSGLPVVVYLPGKLRVEDVDLERVLLFILVTLDTQRAALSPTSPYFSVLYVHSDVTEENQPPSSWLQRLFRILATVASHGAHSDRPLHNNGADSVLRFFYVLKPSLGLKFQLLLSKGYCGGFYNQVVYLQRAEMLDSIAPNLQLPVHIYT
ncbi:hypothetical protein PHYBOEH_007460 [Phytophthora boehmeriae]|uniref:Macro domain-containing protein n=1 Tax=Phytophthora boehmeriae TaxID=109152 RepID=A0A8T1X908_9STRA|nr:hypothetical protein PHYBOEH_007460 [Phytophthora boehmeriae]